MTMTHYPSGLVATSNEHDDLVGLTIGDAVDMVISKDDLIAIAATHAAKRPELKIGQSIYRSVDAHLIAQQYTTSQALAEVARLRRALEHIRSLGDTAMYVAGDPLAVYVTTALNGGTE